MKIPNDITRMMNKYANMKPQHTGAWVTLISLVIIILLVWRLVPVLSDNLFMVILADVLLLMYFYRKLNSENILVPTQPNVHNQVGHYLSAVHYSRPALCVAEHNKQTQPQYSARNPISLHNVSPPQRSERTPVSLNKSQLLEHSVRRPVNGYKLKPPQVPTNIFSSSESSLRRERWRGSFDLEKLGTSLKNHIPYVSRTIMLKTFTGRKSRNSFVEKLIRKPIQSE